jgi:hypothetical protein
VSDEELTLRAALLHQLDELTVLQGMLTTRGAVPERDIVDSSIITISEVLGI